MHDHDMRYPTVDMPNDRVGGVADLLKAQAAQQAAAQRPNGGRPAGELHERIDTQYGQAEALHSMVYRLQNIVDRLAGPEPEQAAALGHGLNQVRSAPEAIKDRMFDVHEKRDVAMRRLDGILNRLEQYI